MYVTKIDCQRHNLRASYVHLMCTITLAHEVNVGNFFMVSMYLNHVR
jgi:hypothetical protein